MDNTFAFLRLVKYQYHDGYHEHYCGYVGIKDNSIYDRLPPTYQRGGDSDDEDLLDNDISVHGGITFDGAFSENEPIIPLTNIPQNWYNCYCYGFDLNHFNDNIKGISTDFEYAKMQALDMKNQVEAMIRMRFPSTGS